MKFMKSFAAFAALAAVALSLPTSVAAQGASKPTVAVLPYTNSALGKAQEELAPLSKGIQDLLIGDLATNPAIRVIERDQIQKILDEQKLSKDNLTDPATAVKVGKLLGVHHMVTGTFVVDPKGNMRIVSKAFSVETSEIEFPNPVSKDASVSGKVNNFLELIEKMGTKLNAGMKLPEIPARVGAAKAEAAKKVPYEAIALYSKGLAAKDAGNKAEAVTLFSKALEKFPDFEKAKAEKAKLQ